MQVAATGFKWMASTRAAPRIRETPTSRKTPRCHATVGGRCAMHRIPTRCHCRRATSNWTSNGALPRCRDDWNPTQKFSPGRHFKTVPPNATATPFRLIARRAPLEAWPRATCRNATSSRLDVSRNTACRHSRPGVDSCDHADLGSLEPRRCISRISCALRVECGLNSEFHNAG